MTRGAHSRFIIERNYAISLFINVLALERQGSDRLIIRMNAALFFHWLQSNLVKQDLRPPLRRSVSSQVAIGDECFTDHKLKERHVNKPKHAGLHERI